LYVGHAARWDEIVFEGDPEARAFLAFYVRGGQVLAVAGMNRDRDMAALAELFRLQRLPAPALLGGDTDFAALLRSSRHKSQRGSADAYATLQTP
ncbi:MAG TPA: oxidoreductase C-terminal domain-containing protein, partial [Pyrinomonadaceae bacterium]|nr:oxidoreductase C-terminal domain-containing protein [Pyrinomonadaceae bacterium]